MHLYVELNLNAAEQARLRALAGSDDIWFAQPEQTTAADAEALLRAEVVLGNCARDAIRHSSHLRWLQLASAGIDYHRGLDWDALAGRVVCTNLRGVFAEPCAQTCLAGILGLFRGIPELAVLQRERRWEKLQLRPRLRTLAQAEVLLLGAGSIAQRLAELLVPFHCRVRTFSRTTGDLTSLEALDEALPQADLVCAMLPDHEQTRGLLSAERLARFKPGALFVNVGRGSVVDETALLAALQEGRLSGAVIDVTIAEPLPPEHPLWSCRNVILTQHSAAGSNSEATVIIDLFERNLARYRRGETLLNIVDWKRGY